MLSLIRRSSWRLSVTVTFYTEERGLSCVEGPDVTMAEWTVKTLQVNVTQKNEIQE